MSQEETEKVAKTATPTEELHPPPSMLWFVIPLGLLALYVVLSR